MLIKLLSKIVSVYMVYLQGMSHQCEINVINTFYNKFWQILVTLLNVLGFLLLASEKKGYKFLICYFLVINIYYFFDLLLFNVHDYCSWYIFNLLKCLRFLKGCFPAFVVPYLTYKKI